MISRAIGVYNPLTVTATLIKKIINYYFNKYDKAINQLSHLQASDIITALISILELNIL